MYNHLSRRIYIKDIEEARKLSDVFCIGSILIDMYEEKGEGIYLIYIHRTWDRVGDIDVILIRKLEDDNIVDASDILDKISRFKELCEEHKPYIDRFDRYREEKKWYDDMGSDLDRRDTIRHASMDLQIYLNNI